MDATKRLHTSSNLVLITLMLFVFLFVFFIYAFLHEGGHAIAGVAFGQTIAEFNFWNLSAHVHMVGGDLTAFQLAVRSIAGATLPFLIWIVFISLVPRKASFILEALKLLYSMTVINTLLSWIFLPMLFLAGKAPSDDVTNFLNYSQMLPLLLTSIALILYIGAWLLFFSKIDSLRGEFLVFRITDVETLLSGTRKAIPVMAGLLLVCALFVSTLNSSAKKNPLNSAFPPQGFETVAQVDLSNQFYSSHILAEFTLNERKLVGVFLVIRNINTTYFDVSLTGPNGFSSVLLHGEGYNAAQDGGLWEQSLPAGSYQLVLNSHQSPGTVSVYLHIR